MHAPCRNAAASLHSPPPRSVLPPSQHTPHHTTPPRASVSPVLSLQSASVTPIPNSNRTHTLQECRPLGRTCPLCCCPWEVSWVHQAKVINTVTATHTAAASSSSSTQPTQRQPTTPTLGTVQGSTTGQQSSGQSTAWQWSSIVTTGSSSVVGEDETTVFFVIAAARSVAKHSQTAVVGHHWCPATSVGGRGVCMCPPRYSWSVNDIPRCHLQTNCSMSDTGTHPVLPLQLRAAAEMDKDGAEAQGGGEGKGGERVPTPTHSLTLLPLSRCSCLMPWRNTPWLTALPPLFRPAGMAGADPSLPQSLSYSLTQSHSLTHSPCCCCCAAPVPAHGVVPLPSRP